MNNTIINKVSNSSLIIVDLQDYKSKGVRTLVDISQWLEEGVLREKAFRQSLKEHNWTQYKDHLVALGLLCRFNFTCMGYTFNNYLFVTICKNCHIRKLK